MKKFLSMLLVALCCVLPVSLAETATPVPVEEYVYQQVDFPEGGFSLSLPDHWLSMDLKTMLPEEDQAEVDVMYTFGDESFDRRIDIICWNAAIEEGMDAEAIREMVGIETEIEDMDGIDAMLFQGETDEVSDVHFAYIVTKDKLISIAATPISDETVAAVYETVIQSFALLEPTA